MKKVVKEWRTTAIALLVVFLIAFILRVVNLTIIPVFADEAIYIRWAQVMRAETTLRFLPLSDGKQPLFMWTVIPFLKIFSDPLFAGRLVSVITGLGTALGIFTLSYLVFKSKKASLVAALMYAISPFSLLFDRMALADSMLAMFSVWTVIFLVITTRSNRLDTAMIAGFALGGAALTKSPALFIAILSPASLFFTKLNNNIKATALQLIKSTGLLAVAGIIAFGMYNILRLGPNFHLIGSRNLDYVHPYSHILTSPLDPLIPHFDRALEWLRILGPELLLFFVLFGIVKNFPKYKKEIIFLCFLAFIPIIVQSEFAKVFTARYIFFTLPFIFVLGGSTYAQKFSNLGNKIMLVVLGIYSVHSLILGIQLISNPDSARLPRSERSGYLEEWTAGHGIKEAADYIKETHNADPSTPIVIGTEGYFGTLPDGLQIYLEKVPNVTVIGVGLGISEVPQPLVESVNSGNSTYLIGNESRFNFDELYVSENLEVIDSYQKGKKPDGSRDSLYLYKVKSIISSSN